MYNVSLTPEAEDSLVKLKKSEPTSYKKAVKLIDELYNHPYSGTGKPEPLSGDRAGQWSRRITKKHRLVYSVDDGTVTVIVLSVAGHYNDK
jgi:toxin YoeB